MPACAASETMTRRHAPSQLSDGARGRGSSFGGLLLARLLLDSRTSPSAGNHERVGQAKAERLLLERDLEGDRRRGESARSLDVLDRSEGVAAGPGRDETGPLRRGW